MIEIFDQPVAVARDTGYDEFPYNTAEISRHRHSLRQGHPIVIKLTIDDTNKSHEILHRQPDVFHGQPVGKGTVRIKRSGINRSRNPRLRTINSYPT